MSYNNFYTYIQLNRKVDHNIFRDSKLFCLMIYCGLRAKRNKEYDDSGLNLGTGEFIIGRDSTVIATDLTVSEYRTKIKKLERMKIIEKIKSTTKFTKYRWIENPYIALNLVTEDSLSNQEIIQEVSTNNNINNNISSLLSYKDIPTNLNNIYRYINIFKLLNTNIIKIIGNYLLIKGIDKKGFELIDDILISNDMLESGRTSEEAVKFMRWLKDKSDNHSDEFPWATLWTLGTVQKKLPEFLANKLEDPRDSMPFGGMYEKVKLK